MFSSPFGVTHFLTLYPETRYYSELPDRFAAQKQIVLNFMILIGLKCHKTQYLSHAGQNGFRSVYIVICCYCISCSWVTTSRILHQYSNTLRLDLKQAYILLIFLYQYNTIGHLPNILVLTINLYIFFTLHGVRVFMTLLIGNPQLSQIPLFIGPPHLGQITAVSSFRYTSFLSTSP